jgi:hypothetical protein
MTSPFADDAFGGPLAAPLVVCCLDVAAGLSPTVVDIPCHMRLVTCLCLDPRNQFDQCLCFSTTQSVMIRYCVHTNNHTNFVPSPLDKRPYLAKQRPVKVWTTGCPHHPYHQGQSRNLRHSSRQCPQAPRTLASNRSPFLRQEVAFEFSTFQKLSTKLICDCDSLIY